MLSVQHIYQKVDRRMTAEFPTASSTASRLIKEGAEQEDIYDTLVAEFRSLITNNVGADALIAWLHPLFPDKARWSHSRAATAIINRKADEARYDEVVRIDDGKIIEIKGMVEKPEPSQAPSNLCIIGRYVLQPKVFGYLERMERGVGGEIQLTDSLAKLIDDGIACHGLRFEGRRFDCGAKAGFLQANIAFALERADLSGELIAFLQNPSAS